MDLYSVYISLIQGISQKTPGLKTWFPVQQCSELGFEKWLDPMGPDLISGSGLSHRWSQSFDAII